MEAMENPVFEQPEVKQGPYGSTFFRSNGVVVDVHRLSSGESFQIANTNEKFRIPGGMMIGQMDFYPFGEREGISLQEEKRNLAVARFIRGISDFFNVYDDLSSDENPQYLIAGLGLGPGASPEFARLLEKKFGFKIDESRGVSVAIGRTREVKLKIDELNSNTPLLERVRKLAASEQ